MLHVSHEAKQQVAQGVVNRVTGLINSLTNPTPPRTGAPNPLAEQLRMPPPDFDPSTLSPARRAECNADPQAYIRKYFGN